MDESNHIISVFQQGLFKQQNMIAKRSYRYEKEAVAYPPPKQFGEFLRQVVMTAWHKQESDFHRNVDRNHSMGLALKNKDFDHTTEEGA